MRRCLLGVLSSAIVFFGLGGFARAQQTVGPTRAGTRGPASAGARTSGAVSGGQHVVYSKTNSAGTLMLIATTATDGQPEQELLFVDSNGQAFRLISRHNALHADYPEGSFSMVVARPNTRTLHIWRGTRSLGGATIDDHGQPVAGSTADDLAGLEQNVLAGSSDLANSALLFAELEGIPLATSADAGTLQTQSLQPENAFGCTLATIATGLALAAWLAEPLDPLAYWAFAAAYTEMANACFQQD
jgi:hypothetical protein